MESTQYEAAERYLTEAMNDRTGIPITEWKAEQEKLITERKQLSRRPVYAWKSSVGKPVVINPE